MASSVRSMPTPKFSQGETVLCYEPDQTMSRVLYEAKVIEVDVTKDEKGKKVPEYFIHFNGWNKSWDRWVLEDQVLKNNDANKALKEKLHEQASKFRKKRKQKVSVSLSNKSDDSQSSTGKTETEENLEGSDQSKVEIEIPSQLKLKLEDDCYLIKRKKKLVSLPRSPCVDDVLEQYYKQYIDTHSEESCQLVQELMDGLKIYFNFTLPTLLLYNFEREQFRNIMQIPSAELQTYMNKNEKAINEEKCSIVSSTTENTSGNAETQSSIKEKEKRSLRRRPLRRNAAQAEQQVSNETTAQSDQTEPSNQSNPTPPEDTQSASVSSTSSPTETAMKIPIKRKANELEEDAEMSSEGVVTGSPTPMSITAALLHASCKALPSQIYGPEHLLRLFVKLPGLLGRTDMPEVNLTTLLDHIDLFLRYLVDNFSTLFPEEVYYNFL